MIPYTFIENLPGLMTDIAPDSIISRTIYKDASLNVVLFGFDQGQALSEHSAGQPAVIHILQGEATLTLDGDTFEVRAGSWARLPARLPHSVHAKTPLVMLLLLLNEGQR